MENLDPPEPTDEEVNAEMFSERVFEAKLKSLQKMIVQDFFDVLDVLSCDAIKIVIEALQGNAAIENGIYLIAEALKEKARLAYLAGGKDPAQLIAMQGLLDELQS